MCIPPVDQPWLAKAIFRFGQHWTNLWSGARLKMNLMKLEGNIFHKMYNSSHIKTSVLPLVCSQVWSHLIRKNILEMLRINSNLYLTRILSAQQPSTLRCKSYKPARAEMGRFYTFRTHIWGILLSIGNDKSEFCFHILKNI